MTKIRLNLRNVATIVACLAVTTMFASCGENKDDDDGNGKDRVLNADEKELVGPWRGALGHHSMYYEFREDGTYSYVTQQEIGFAGSSNWTITRGVGAEIRTSLV